MEAKELARVAHALPHRVRLSSPVLAGRRAACERVARALAAEGSFDRVTVRPETGSVIVEGEALDAAALERRLRELVAAERDEEGRPLAEAPRGEPHPGPTRVARAVVHAVAEINVDVREALGGHADLSTLAPMFFAAAGLAEVGTTGKVPVPNWYNLLWWSMRWFMTFNLRAVEEESQAANGAGVDPRKRAEERVRI